ncbi:glutathione S-transferase family protein [Kordiimonas pumila]|uniref:Glutathione S-transferase family protein n=1 Tax=Kordiimonas pumila TaxID=2161677 RepID=A0ABV7D8I7_9PROT|nr:glutathione S-transferase family protein [Kordiimonas pumila]
MSLTVYGLIASPFYRKVCTLLAAKGVPFQTEVLSPFGASEDFTLISPARRIPVLKDSDIADDFYLADSSAIVQYIERKYPELPMFPTDAADYGKAVWFEEYADSEMASKIGLGVFRPIVFPQRAGKEPDVDTALATIREKLPAIHDYIEKSLTGKKWLTGDMFSVADIAVAVQYANLSFAGYVPSATRWPNLAAFMKRVGKQESFTKFHIEAALVLSELKKVSLDKEEDL